MAHNQAAIAGPANDYPATVGMLGLPRTLDPYALLALLLALGLRLYRLDYQSLWADEAFALRIASEPYHNLVQALAATEPHPPLYYGLLHLWRDLGGESDFALRLLSTLFSVVAVAAVYGVGRHLLGRRAGLAAVLLMAVNPFQVWYAQETRMYSMLAGLTALSALFFYTALTRGGRYRWIAFTAVTILAVFTHYHALFVVVFEDAVALIWWLRFRRAARPWLASQVVLLIAFLPWVYYAKSIFGSWSGWMPLVDLPTMFARTFSTQTLGTSFPSDSIPVVALCLAIWAVLSWLLLLRGRAKAALYLALYALVPLVGAYLLGELLGRSMFHERYLIVVSPVFSLLLGHGLGWRGWRWPVSTFAVIAAAVVAAISLQNYYLDWHYQKDDLRGLARYISARAREGDLVVASISRQWLYQHYAGDVLPVYVIPPDDGPAQVGDDLAQAVPGHHRLWYLPYAFSDVDNAVDRWLAEHAYPTEVHWFNNARVELVGVAPDAAPRTIKADFAGEVSLVQIGLPDDAFTPGDVIPLALFWQRQQSPIGDLKTSLRLLDSRGHLFAQVDRSLGGDIHPPSTWLPGQPVRDNLGLLLPIDAPPGEYGLELHVYDSTTGKDLSRLDEHGSPVGSAMDLATIRVSLPAKWANPSTQEVGIAARAAFGNIAQLNGFNFPVGQWQAGTRVAVTLNWQALQPNGLDYRPVLRLIDARGAEVANSSDRIAGGALPTIQWQSGTLVRDVQDWRLPPGLSDGNYTVSLRLESTTGEPLPVAGGGSTATLGKVTVRAAANYSPAVPPEHPTEFALGDFARLAGYDLSSADLYPGETVRLTLHWQAQGKTSESYKVFTHLLSADERVFGQQDSIPCAGNCPTSGWGGGQTFADQYAFTVQPEAPPGVYRIEVGMYRPTSGKRLPASNAGQPIGDRIILGEVVVH